MSYDNDNFFCIKYFVDVENIKIKKKLRKKICANENETNLCEAKEQNK